MIPIGRVSLYTNRYIWDDVKLQNLTRTVRKKISDAVGFEVWSSVFKYHGEAPDHARIEAIAHQFKTNPGANINDPFEFFDVTGINVDAEQLQS